MLVTEFNDSAHYGLFLTNPNKLDSGTVMRVRESELVLAALRAAGVFDNMIDGTSAPATDKLWLDKNFDPAVLKEWDATGASWVPMTFDRLFGRAAVGHLTVTGGTGNAIVVSQPAGFKADRLYLITPTANNTTAVTIQVSGVGTYDVKYGDGSALLSGEFTTGRQSVLFFDGIKFTAVFSIAGLNAYVTAAQAAASAAATSAGIAAAAQAIAEAAALISIGLPPGRGRLTLASGVPVPESDMAGQTTIYFTPIDSASFYLWNGTAMVARAFAELNVPLSTTYHTSGAIYDLFVFWNGSSLVLGTGASWASDTARTLALELYKGAWVNATNHAIRWGTTAPDTTTVTARQARYVGSFRATANGQASDSRLRRLLFNADCQALRPLFVEDTTNTWAYSTATYRQVNAATGNKVEILNGLGGTPTRINAMGLLSNSTTTPRAGVTGIGIDSTTVNSATIYTPAFCTNTVFAVPLAEYFGCVGLGYHALNWLERGGGTDTQSWWGSNAGANAWRTGMAGEYLG